MKKWIIIVVIVGVLGWVVYDYVATKTDSTAGDEENTVDVEAVSESDTASVGLEKGDTAPDFELETFDNETVTLSDLRGEKVLLNFWATWCPPCRAEMPDLEKFHNEYEDVVILGVNLTETENSSRNVDEFIDEYGITFSILSDANTEVATTYQAQALPTSYIIDREGKIDNKAIGPLNYDSMLEAFDQID